MRVKKPINSRELRYLSVPILLRFRKNYQIVARFSGAMYSGSVGSMVNAW